MHERGLALETVHDEQPDEHGGSDQHRGDSRGTRQPQDLPSTNPKVRAPMPAVASTTPSGSGRSTSCPGTWWKATGADDEGHDADGDVDQEHQAPVDGDEQTANHRAQCGGNPPCRGPGPDRARPALRFVGGQDQAERSGRQGRCARGLDEAGDNQHRHAGGGRAGCRGRREDRDSEAQGIPDRGRTDRRAGQRRRAMTRTRWRSR